MSDPFHKYGGFVPFCVTLQRDLIAVGLPEEARYRLNVLVEAAVAYKHLLGYVAERAASEPLFSFNNPEEDKEEEDDA